MGHRADMERALPAMLRHEGWWDGWYRHFDTEGAEIDAHKVKTHCIFPDDGPWHYYQENWLEWPDGRKAAYEFGGRMEGDRLVWDIAMFTGFAWQTTEDTVMLSLDWHEFPDTRFIEMIHLAPGNAVRARTWQWFRDGLPWKRTLCDEHRIEGP